MRASHWKVRKRERVQKNLADRFCRPLSLAAAFAEALVNLDAIHSFFLTSLILLHLQLCVFAICLNGDNK